MNTPIIQCNQLSKSYGNRTALTNLDFSLEKGQIVGLLGPNGSGKTTFIKILNGLLTPTSGEILINGALPSKETKGIVSYLPDRTYLNDKMTTEQIIDFFLDFYDDFDSERAYQMMVSLNIDPFIPLKNFSKGTKEKVQLILVMSRNAALYVLDEPIGGVDPASRDYILNTIITNYNPEATVLISTHLIADVETILDRVLFIQNGSIVLNSTVDDIRAENAQSVNDLFREVFRCY
ncbi:MAG: ABC transporter ATP-binding protein [Eubacteriales bacterium]